MPHLDDGLKREGRPRQAARTLNTENRTDAKNTTAGRARNRAGCSTPPERKSPRDARRAALLEAMGLRSTWREVRDVLASPAWTSPEADPLLLEVLEAGRFVEGEPGDGAAAFLPDGEVLCFEIMPDGSLGVRLGGSNDDVARFLSGEREAA